MNSDEVKIYPKTYMLISLLSDKINVLIIGGGKAAYIKAKAFANRGCCVTVVAKSFAEELTSLDSDCITFIQAAYDQSHISGYHLVIIATDDEDLNQQIQADCEEADKLYLTCSDYRRGQFVTPVMRETEQAVLALHTKSGSPKTSVFVAEKLQKMLQDYDRFIEFVCELRQQLKNREDKNEIMRLVNSDEFFVLFVQGKHHEFCERYNIDSCYAVNAVPPFRKG